MLLLTINIVYTFSVVNNCLLIIIDSIPLHVYKCSMKNEAQHARKGRLVAYGRVSTDDQSSEMQRAAFLKAGVHPDNIHIDDGVSGIAKKRRGLALAFLDLRPGDTLVVWKIDRLGRDLRQLIDHAEAVKKSGADLKSLTEPIDTSHPMGKAFFFLIGVFAQLERDLIAERTRAGMANAKAKGVRFGAKPRITELHWQWIEWHIRNGDSAESVARRYGVSASIIRKQWDGGGGLLRLRALGPMPKPKQRDPGKVKPARKRKPSKP